MIKYKSYVGVVDFDEEAEIFYGEVINTRDVITFQGKTAKALKQAFIDSVDDYLEFCEEREESPERPFSGRFNVRIDPELHKEAYVAARHAGKSLNTWINEAITQATVHHSD